MVSLVFTNVPFFSSRLQGATDWWVYQRSVPVFATSMRGSQWRWECICIFLNVIQQGCLIVLIGLFYTLFHDNDIKKGWRIWVWLRIRGFCFCQISRTSWEPKLETQPQWTSLSALLTICSVFRCGNHRYKASIFIISITVIVNVITRVISHC